MNKAIIILLMLIICSVFVLADQTVYGNLYTEHNSSADIFKSRDDQFCNATACYPLSDFLDKTTDTRWPINTTTLQNQSGTLGVKQSWLDSLFARILDVKSWISSNSTSLDTKIDSIGNWTADKTDYSTTIIITGWIDSNYTELDGKISSMDNLTLAEIAINIGNWSTDKSNYYTTTQIDTLGNWSADKGDYSTTITIQGWIDSNYSDLDSKISSMDNLTLAQIVTNIGNWTDEKGNYYTSAEVNSIISSMDNLTLGDIVTNIGNWSADKDDYSITTTVQSWIDGNYTDLDNKIGSMDNLTLAEIVTNIGNWSLDKASYQIWTTTKAYIDSIGNWTLDKVNYYTSTETDNIISTLPNLSLSDVSDNIGNWSDEKENYYNTTEIDDNNDTLVTFINDQDKVDDLHLHACDNITGATSDLCTIVDTDTHVKGDENYLYNDTDTMYFNESKLEVTFYNASVINVVTGTGSGTLGDIQTYNRITYNVTETNSDFELIVNFTNITEFTTLLVRHKTDSDKNHITTIQIWDYGDSDWEGYGILSEELTSRMQTFGVYDATDHIQDGVVQVRFYQVEGPPNTAHIHQFDWVSLSKGFGTPVGQEIDPLSVHRDGKTPLTGDWDAGDYNIIAKSFNASNWDNVTITESQVSDLTHTNLSGDDVVEMVGNFSASTILKNITAVNCTGTDKYSSVYPNGTLICSAESGADTSLNLNPPFIYNVSGEGYFNETHYQENLTQTITDMNSTLTDSDIGVFGYLKFLNLTSYITDSNTSWVDALIDARVVQSFIQALGLGFYTKTEVYNTTEINELPVSTFENDASYFDNIANFTGTLTNGKTCTYDSGNTEIDCDTTLTVGTVTSVTGTAPIVSSEGATPAISIPVATSIADGYLDKDDWTIFNNKADSDTTYSAGDGISEALTVFTVAGGTALTQDAGGLSVTDGGIGDTQIADAYINQALTTTSDPEFAEVNATGNSTIAGIKFTQLNSTHWQIG